MESLEFYQKLKLAKNSSISSRLIALIRQDSKKIIANFIDSIEREQKIMNVILIFLIKYPDIIYNRGVILIINGLLNIFSVESDIFVILCHIFQFIYPTVKNIQNFYTGIRHCQIIKEETKLFALYASRLRPKLKNALSILVKNENITETYTIAFDLAMSRLSESWFKSLFSNVLIENDLLRVWDNLFIAGFDFIQKFGLSLLSKNENFFKNSIKQEIKSLNRLKFNIHKKIKNIYIKMLIFKI